jgi:5'-3' exonuclease
VEGDLDLQEISKLAPLPKKIATKKKTTIITMQDEDEEGEKAGKNWADGEVLHLIVLQEGMELEFTKNAKKQGKFQLIETLNLFFLLCFHN